MNIHWISDIEEFKTVRDEWDEALECSGADNPFLLSDLIISWWEVFGRNRKLSIFVLYNKGSIVGGFPLYIERLSFKKGSLRRLQHIGNGYSNITEPFYLLDSNKFKKRFFTALKANPEWDLLYITRLRTDFIGFSKGDLRQFDKVRENGVRVIISSHDQNAKITISQNAESYLMTCGKNLRNNVRKARKKAESIGKVVLVKIDDFEEINNLYDLHIEFSINSHAVRNRRSAFDDQRHREVAKKIISSFARRQYLDAHVLKFGDVISAVSFGYRFGDGLKWIFTSYNSQLSHTSPGHTLIYELIDYAYRNGDPYFDMYYGGNVFYKRQWCNKFHPLYDVKIFNSTITGKLAHLVCQKLRHD